MKVCVICGAAWPDEVEQLCLRCGLWHTRGDEVGGLPDAAVETYPWKAAEDDNAS